MLLSAQRVVASVVLAACFIPAAVLAAGVEVLTKSMFPSNRHTVLDFSQNTFRRVNLAKPDCAPPRSPVPCWDIDVLNTLDGFNIQPRLSIPFSGPIDVSSVNSDSVFLVSLGSTLGWGSFGDKVGINQVVWDPATDTLHAESDELLEQHTRYALVVTNRVRDASGNPIQPRRFRDRDHDSDVAEASRHTGLRIVGVSIFTTQSVTSTLEKIRKQIDASTPPRASFNLGPAGARTVFPLDSVASAVFRPHVATGAAGEPILGSFGMPIAGLRAIPSVATLAFGKYSSPDYLGPEQFIPPVGTRTGVPTPLRMNDVYFTLILPAGTRPSAGWPVAIYGHGFTDFRHNSPFAVGASMAAAGVATIAINVVGHGFGPEGTVAVTTPTTMVTFPAGGRGIDQNGDKSIGSTEGSSAGGQRILIGSADALRQTTVDLMQLVRQIQVGIDVDGDGAADLDASRIYYFGQSFGGIYGTIFLGVEPDVRVGAPNVPGGPIIDIIRLSPVFRGLFVQAALARGFTEFNENLPLRDQPPVINTVPNAMGLQNFTEQSEWASQFGNPVAYAPYIRKAPLQGNAPKSVIYQFAKGDQTVPNPTTSGIIRAGDLADRTTYFRNDTAFAAGGGMAKNPHTFLTGIGSGGISPIVAFKAQAQIAAFFASHGGMTIDPDADSVGLPYPAGFPHLFEVPIAEALPETLNYIP